MNLIGKLGKSLLLWARDIRHLLAVLATVSWMSTRPRYWPATVRNVLARQILFTGVEAIFFHAVLAAIVGASVVLQISYWLGRVAKSQFIGPVLVTLIVCELAPLLANVVVIIRSASAVATEMANMKASGEVRLLDAQGLDPLVYLVMPRVIGMAVSVLGLAVLFVVVSLVSGNIIGELLGIIRLRPIDFFYSVLGALQPSDVLNLLLKSVLPAMLTACICCVEGLSVGTALSEIPRSTSRGLARSVIAVFFVSAVVSVLTYI